MLRPPIFTPDHAAVLLAVLCWTVWFSVVGIPRAQAQSITERLTGSPKVPWQISADSVAYDAQATTYHASGNVTIEKEAVRLVADAVAFNHKAMTATAEGHVVMTAGGDVLTGERLDLNLTQETGVAYDGSVFLQENHFIIHGDRIEKTGKATYEAENASVTTCDGDPPDWIITGRTVKVTIDGYGTATHAVFKAREIPVLYTPYLIFPAKNRRQTGLLLPDAGYSDRWGFYWDQPLFWAINDSSDATLYADVMEKRGTKIGLEYRYALTDDSFGALMADGLRDDKIDDGTEEATRDWGYDDDDYDRPNRDRYWLRAKLDQELPGNAMARLDLDIVSDQDYLTEFREGRSGFYTTRDYYLETFGRDLDTYDDDIRTNRLNINKTWDRYALNGDLLWYDNIVKRRWEELDTTLQRLPQIRFDSAKQTAFDSSIYWDLDSEYVYFYREDGQRAHRTDIYPRAYLPFKWKYYLSVEPSFGWRHTAWVMDHWNDDTLDQTTYRQIYDLELDLSTELSKVMGSPISGVDRIRHSIKPQVVYTYIPHQDQSDLPSFTKTDRIAEANKVTYSLTNTFTARLPRKAGEGLPAGEGPDPEAPVDYIERAIGTVGRPDDGAESGDHPEPAPESLSAGDPFAYNRFCRFYLRQSYDLVAAGEDDAEPFSDIYGELDFYFGRYVRLNSDASYDTYDTRFSAHNVAIGLIDKRGDRLWVEHRYKANKYESIRNTALVRLTDHLAVRGEYERNLLDDQDIIRGVGLLYAAQCWSIDLYYSIEKGDDNKQLSVEINLTGIGGFGN